MRDPLTRQNTTSSNASSNWTDASSAKAKKRKRKKRWMMYPKSRKEILDVFTLSRTNQILQGHSPSALDSLSPRKPKEEEKGSRWERAKKAAGRKKEQKPIFSSEAKKWMDLVTSELFSATVSVLPKPAEFNANIVPTDPRRGRYKGPKDFGLPNVHLCKLVRQKLLSKIISKYSLVQPKINSNLGKKTPSKKELEEWKLRRARKDNEKRRKRKVISTKRRKISARYRPCNTCGEFHFKRACGGRDQRINLMVQQIYQKAEIIKDTMAEAWDKLENLENAYHDMLMRVHRLQSNRVCIGELTGEDYPGEEHPVVCPCVEIKEKEVKDQEKKEERAKEDEKKKQEEEERKEMERQRRERIIETRKRRFYSKLQEGQRYFPGRFAPSMETIVRFQTDEPKPEVYSDDEEATEDQVSSSFPTNSESSNDEAKKQEDISPTMYTGLTDLTRLEASRRRKSKFSLMDDVEMESKPRSLLSRIMEKAEGRRMELIVMDGSVKSIGYTYEEDGGMIKEELNVESLPLDDKESSEAEATELDQITELDEEEEDEEEEELEEPKPKEPPPAKEEEERMPFGDFLDLMEVF